MPYASIGLMVFLVGVESSIEDMSVKEFKLAAKSTVLTARGKAFQETQLDDQDWISRSGRLLASLHNCSSTGRGKILLMTEILGV